LISAKVNRLAKYRIKKDQEIALLYATWGEWYFENEVDESSKLPKNPEETCLWLGKYIRFMGKKSSIGFRLPTWTE
jgi:hypothetical protein